MLVFGLVFGLVGGLVGGLVYGLVFGLVYGLSITFITQLICLINGCSEFSMFSLIGSLILLVVVQVVGWFIVLKLREGEK